MVRAGLGLQADPDRVHGLLPGHGVRDPGDAVRGPRDARPDARPPGLAAADVLGGGAALVPAADLPSSTARPKEENTNAVH